MEDDFSVTYKLEAKYGREFFPHGRQQIFTLEAKHGRKLLPRGRPQIFYLETGGQIWKGINLFMEDDSCPLNNLLQHHTK
jgi:hypothetical protein